MNSIKPNLALLLFPGTLVAAQLDNTLAMLGSESMYLEELPVVISATRLEQPLSESPVATTVIDREMIDASGAQTIADILRLVPGFTVGYLNGNYPVATYHGQSARYSSRIQLLIDGRSVYLPTLSGVSWSDLVITPDEIERIEVIRGPNASTFGNNSFLAVVSITTRHASEDRGHYTKVTAGSHDTADAVYRFGGHTDRLDYRVSLGTKNNDGTELLEDHTETDYLSYRLDYQLDLQTQFFYQGGIQDSIYGDVLENADDSDNEIDVTTAFQHFKLEHSFNDLTSLSVQYYYNYTKSMNSNYLATISLADVSPFFSTVDDFDIYSTINLESVRHDFEVDYYYSPLDSLRLVSGLSIRADKVIAESVFDPMTDNTLWLYRAFTHGEYRLTDDVIINAGLMIEDNEISGTDVAPRVAIIQHLNDQHSIRISYSSATRTPTIFDENGYIAIEHQLTENGGQPLTNPLLLTALNGDIINDTLYYTSGGVSSEEIKSVEFGWMSQLLDNTLILDFKLFNDRTRKLIAEVPYIGDVPTENVDDLFGPTYSGVGANDIANSSRTKTRGFEFYSDYQITPDWRLYSFLSYIEIKAQNTNPNAEASVVGRLEESVPRRSFGAMLMKRWPDKLNTSLAVYHVADMDWLDRTHNRSDPVNNAHEDRSAEDYTRVDFVLRKTVDMGKNELNYAFILQNITGTHFDYTRTSYTDLSFDTVNIPGSEQDPRGYFELAIKFN